MIAKLARDRSGSVAVEFALLAPLLLLVLAAVVDLGSAGATRLFLEDKLTAAADYALLQSAPADSDAAEALATTLTALLQGGTTDAAEVTVNNAATVQWADGQTTVLFGAGEATACYCPAISEGRVSWGAPTDCGAPCSGGGTSGRFVEITATANHVTMFSGYGFLDGDTVEARTVLRLP